MFYYISNLIGWSLLRPFIKEYKGLENIPKKGPFILALNHFSYIDSVVISPLIYIKKHRFVHFIAMKDLFRTPFQRLLFKHYFRCIKVNGSIDKALDYLDKGKAVGIFPSGLRSKDGEINKGRTGVATLALKSKSPVIPVGLSTFDFWPIQSKFPRFNRTIKINIGKPMKFKEFYNKKLTKKNKRKVTDKIMEKIESLLNEDR